MTNTIYQTITDNILRQIEAGAGDFKMPWHRGTATGLPVNAATGNEYNGSNVMVLWCAAMAKGYASNTWATYKQWQSLGAQVRKGEKSTTGIYFSTFEKEQDGKITRLPFAKALTLFNADQVDGWIGAAPKDAIDITTRLDAVDTLVANLGVTVKHEGTRAFYHRTSDTVYMPMREAFTGTNTINATEAYYATLLHEIAHWTGAEKRLDRTKGKTYGDEAYAYEELVAELAAAFLCCKLGVTNEPRADHAQYLASWLKVLKSDPRAITKASADAQRAADFIIGKEREEKEQTIAA